MSSAVSCRVIGLPQFLDNLLHLEKRTRERAIAAVNEATVAAQKVAIAGTPVGRDRPGHKAGTLRRGNKIRRGGGSGITYNPKAHRYRDSASGQWVPKKQVLAMGGPASGPILYELYNDVEYAKWVLWGHRTRNGGHVAGHDWMTPALIRGREVLRKRGAEFLK